MVNELPDVVCVLREDVLWVAHRHQDGILPDQLGLSVGAGSPGLERVDVDMEGMSIVKGIVCRLQDPLVDRA